MRGLLRRYTRLTVPQKRLYSALTVLTMVALLLYCLGIGSFLLRSRLVTETALEIPPTFTASPTPMPTSVAPPQSTATPTATLPPTPTQRPIPTFTPTPESVNVTVVITSTEGVTSTTVISATVTPTATFTPTITSTEGVTSTTVISATVTPTATFTPTITTTAEASLTLPAAETAARLVGGSTPPSVNESGCYAQLSPGPSYEIAGKNTSSWFSQESRVRTDILHNTDSPQPTFCKSTALTLRYG